MMPLVLLSIYFRNTPFVSAHDNGAAYFLSPMNGSPFNSPDRFEYEQNDRRDHGDVSTHFKIILNQFALLLL